MSAHLSPQNTKYLLNVLRWVIFASSNSYLKYLLSHQQQEKCFLLSYFYLFSVVLFPQFFSYNLL